MLAVMWTAKMPTKYSICSAMRLYILKSAPDNFGSFSSSFDSTTAWAAARSVISAIEFKGRCQMRGRGRGRQATSAEDSKLGLDENRERVERMKIDCKPWWPWRIIVRGGILSKSLSVLISALSSGTLRGYTGTHYCTVAHFNLSISGPLED